MAEGLQLPALMNLQGKAADPFVLWTGDCMNEEEFIRYNTNKHLVAVRIYSIFIKIYYIFW
jgi:hypothetical protein